MSGAGASIVSRSSIPRDWHPGFRSSLPGALTVLLALPLVLPAAYGVAAALEAALALQTATSADSLWPVPRTQALLLRGLWIGGLSAALATALGAAVALALLLSSANRWRVALGSLLVASFCFGSVVHLMAWRTLFPGISGGAGGWALAVLTLGGRYAPLCAAMFAAGLMSLDRAELEASLFAGGARAVAAVARGRLLRLAGMSLAAVGALVFSETELPPLLGVYIYAQEFMSLVALEASPGAAAAQGWPLMLVATICGALLAGLPRIRAGTGSGQVAGWLGGWVHPPPALRAAVVAAFLVAALPLCLLAIGTWQATGRWQAVPWPMLWRTLLTTLWVAAVASAWACLWSWALAAWAVRAGRVASTALHVLLPTLMLWPSSLTALAVLALASSDLSPVLEFADASPLVTAHFLRILPFTAWLMLAMREAEPTAPREQLRVLGASTWASLRHVHAPAACPRLAAAFMLGLGLSLAELTATVLTVPPGMETVILRLYNLLHYGDQRGVMSLALVQGVAVAGIVALALAGARFSKGRHARGG